MHLLEVRLIWRERVVEIERPLEIPAFDISHHQIVRPDILKIANVRGVERRNGAGFRGEAFRELGVGNFDCYVAMEAVVMGAIHLTHAPLPMRTRIS